jgi:hypothetical protein
MKKPLSRFEFGLLFTLAGAVLLACWGPVLMQARTLPRLC